MAKRRATLSDLMNDLTFRTIYNKYKLISMNAFEWKNLPDGIEARHIERELFQNGKAIFFKDPGMGFMCLRAVDERGINVYGEPLHYRAQGFGYNHRFTADNCVIIENNLNREATEPFVLFYVNKLTEAERTMDVNVKANKTPVIIACDDTDLLSFKAIFKQVDGNVPAIYADKRLNLEAFGVFDTKVKFLCNDLMDYKKSVENELLTFLGLNNIAQDKKERLITDEAEANNQLIDSFSELQLEARERACEAINKLYGLNVSVEKRQKEVGTHGDGMERDSNGSNEGNT